LYLWDGILVELQNCEDTARLGEHFARKVEVAGIL
jgi:hypothetical protein